jgi:hypothetical protein
LEEAGHRIFGKQDEGELVITPNIVVRYHPDGLTYWKDSATVVEIKALADAGWQKSARYSVGDYIDEYKWQLSVMMIAEGLPGLWVAFNKGISNGAECPDKGRMLYESVMLPPINFTTIRDKAIHIKELIDGDDILASGRECDDTSHFPCRYLHLRPEESTKGWLMSDTPVNNPIEMVDATLSIDDEDKKKHIDFLVREYVVNKGLADEAKAKQDAARDELIELSKFHKRMMTDKWLIPIVKGTNTSPDWASMPQDLKDEVNKYKKSTEYRYLRDIKNLGE